MPNPIIRYQVLPVALFLVGMPITACSQTGYYEQNPNIQVVDATTQSQSFASSSGNSIISQNQAAAPVVQAPVAAKPAASTQPRMLASNTTQPSASGAGVVKPYVPDNVLGSDLRSENLTPVTLGADQYQVVLGDTLYSIAFRFGIDYRSLAKNNNIDPPYSIKVGQILNLNLKSEEAPVYIVKKGDTLYSIAKEQGQSVPFLAGVNNISEPYTVKVGQKLYLARQKTAQKATKSDKVIVAGSAQAAPAKTAKKEPAKAAPAKKAEPKKAEPKQTAQAKPKSTPAKTAAAAPKPVDTRVYSSKSRKVGGVTWSWPANGKVIEGFSLSEQGNKGIDISSSRGSRVLASADGQIVYAGNALRGYGNLVIINHANEYLSAYAHNEQLMVKEGQRVKRGQQIARMGSTDAQSVRLHFEIRYRGQSVNPVGYLPK